VHTSPQQSIETHRHRSDEGLTLAGLHLCHFTLVEDDAADELHVKGAHIDSPLGRLAYSGKGIDQKVVQALTRSQAGPELVGECPQTGIGALLHLGLEGVYPVNQWLQLAYFSFVGIANDFVKQSF